MPNGYSTIPNIIPGNLNVQGQLYVTSGAFLYNAGVGTQPKRVILESVADGAGLAFNLGTSLQLLDPANFGYGLLCDPATRKLFARITNLTPTALDAALRLTILTDYTQHINTGNITENTLVSKVIPAGVLGANGALRVVVGWRATTVSASADTLRVRYGGLEVMSQAVNNAGVLVMRLEGAMATRNNAAQQYSYCVQSGGTNPVVLAYATGVNSAVDQTLAITVQNGAAGNSNQVEFAEVELVNTFGPVT